MTAASSFRPKIQTSEIYDLQIVTTKIKETITDNIIDDLTTVVEDRLDQLSIVGADPGNSIDLGHLKKKVQDQLNKIFKAIP